MGAAAAMSMVLSRPLAAQPRSPAPDAAAEIRSREETLMQAMHARDRMHLEQLLASDYVLRAAPDIERAAALVFSLRRLPRVP